MIWKCHDLCITYHVLYAKDLTHVHLAREGETHKQTMLMLRAELWGTSMMCGSTKGLAWPGCVCRVRGGEVTEGFLKEALSELGLERLFRKPWIFGYRRKTNECVNIHSYHFLLSLSLLEDLGKRICLVTRATERNICVFYSFLVYFGRIFLSTPFCLLLPSCVKSTWQSQESN